MRDGGVGGDHQIQRFHHGRAVEKRLISRVEIIAERFQAQSGKLLGAGAFLQADQAHVFDF